MANLIEAGKISDLKDGNMKEVLAQGRVILVAKIEDKYYAADNRCPHLGGNLSQGKLEGTIVTCLRHGSQFDLTDGRIVRWTTWSGMISRLSKVLKPPKPLTVYNTKIENGKILIEI
ncbi:Rieske (2Fe-2S) protein [Chloroflexota bacterium]